MLPFEQEWLRQNIQTKEITCVKSRFDAGCTRSAGLLISNHKEAENYVAFDHQDITSIPSIAPGVYPRGFHDSKGHLSHIINITYPEF